MGDLFKSRLVTTSVSSDLDMQCLPLGQYNLNPKVNCLVPDRPVHLFAVCPRVKSVSME